MIWKSKGFSSSCGNNSDGLLNLAFWYKGLESMFYVFILVLCLLGCLWPGVFPMGTMKLLKIRNHLWQESWFTCGSLSRLAKIVVSWPLLHRSRNISCLTKLKQEKNNLLYMFCTSSLYHCIWLPFERSIV